MDTAVWTEFVPVVTVLAGSGALVQRFVVSPHLAARRREKEALNERLDRMYAEITETRKEMHLMCRAFLDMKQKLG